MYYTLCLLFILPDILIKINVVDEQFVRIPILSQVLPFSTVLGIVFIYCLRYCLSLLSQVLSLSTVLGIVFIYYCGGDGSFGGSVIHDRFRNCKLVYSLFVLFSDTETVQFIFRCWCVFIIVFYNYRFCTEDTFCLFLSFLPQEFISRIILCLLPLTVCA